MQTWARSQAQSELYALIVAAIKTAEADRDADQQHAVEWMASLVHGRAVAMAQAAGAQYASWAGLGVSDYWHHVHSGTSLSDLTAFLTTTPKPYDTLDPSRATSGYCKYRSPAPYETEYTGYLYQVCYTPCTFWVCDAPRPSYDQFVRWGQAVATGGWRNSGYLANAAAIAQALALTRAEAATGTLGAGTALMVLPAAFLAIAPFTVAATAAGVYTLLAMQAIVPLGVVIFAVTAVVLASIRFADGLALPGKLAALVVGARDATYDPATLIDTDDGASTLFSVYADATLPVPDADRQCDNSLIPLDRYGDTDGSVLVWPPLGDGVAREPISVDTTPCLNQPAVTTPTPADPDWLVRAPGQLETRSGTITTFDARSNATITTRVSNGWFVHRINHDGQVSEVQSLTFAHRGVDGDMQLVWLDRDANGEYGFVGVKLGSATAFDTDTCLTDGTCWTDQVIRYVAANGNEVIARLEP